VLALAALGRSDDAYRAFSIINPVNHAADRAAADRYRVEPYVVAADVYSQAERAGRGGWTWYTGSAGWLYRAAVEGILGIERTGETVSIAPRLPSNWPGFHAKMRFGQTEYRISVNRGSAESIVLDGTQVQQIKLSDQGHHEVVVTVANGELG
jgi:cyclic beta-1,2-glucan synthetase